MDKRQAIVAELPRLRRYARALARDAVFADDLVQDCVVRALSRLSLFREGTNMRSWLFTIMHNLFVNAMRARNRGSGNETSSVGIEDAIAVAPAQDNGLAVRDVGRALELLGDEQREVVLLVGLEEMSYRETAEVLGIPIGTVMSRLARGREQLRRTMESGSAVLRRVK